MRQAKRSASHRFWRWSSVRIWSNSSLVGLALRRCLSLVGGRLYLLGLGWGLSFSSTMATFLGFGLSFFSIW